MNFPPSPIVGQRFTSGTSVWQWDGTRWGRPAPFDARMLNIDPITGLTASNAQDALQAMTDTWFGGDMAAHNVFTPEQFGATGNDPNHDDAPGIEAACDAAVAAALADETYSAVVQLSAKIYYCLRPAYRRADAFAQICLPNPPYVVNLVITGPNQLQPVQFPNSMDTSVPGAGNFGGASPLPQGASIKSTAGGTFDSTNGAPSIIGGPNSTTRTMDWTGLQYYRLNLIIRDLTFVAPPNPSISGLWLEFMWSAALYRVNVIGGSINPANWSCGVVMPTMVNIGFCNLFEVGIKGWYCGLVYAEHLFGSFVEIGYNIVCLAPDLWCQRNGWQMIHASSFGHLLMEQSSYYLGAWLPESGLAAPYGCVPTNIHLAIEDRGSDAANYLPVAFPLVAHVYDPNNRLRFTGTQNRWQYAHTEAGIPSGRTARLVYNGGAAVNLQALAEDNLNLSTTSVPNIGPQTPPALPGSTVELQNPFARNASVSISGGTVTSIQLRAGNTIAKTQVGTTTWTGIVPANGFLTLTYSAAPNWVWSTF